MSQNPSATNVSTSRFLEWNARHPVLAIVLVSFLAVVINCYPVIFCGKSFVSPSSTDDMLVYNWWPPLPGMEQWPLPTENVVHSTHGSDTVAIMWWEVPAGFLESRSILDEGELPLWNRYSHAGDTLIGQGISMLGDPLQLIVILGRGSAVAWDIKFLTAKFLFCVGFGWLILRLLGNRPLSLIYAALAAYCGAYFFINNHPSFFVFAYAPWILLSALGWLDLRSRCNVSWGLVWLWANVSCFNAGHVEVAVDLIGGLNLVAVIYGLSGYGNIISWGRVLGRMGLGTLLFLGLTAPMWISFLVALKGAYSVHLKIQVSQLPITSFPGAFDDIFYLFQRPDINAPDAFKFAGLNRFLHRPDNCVDAFAPGSSLLILAGCVISVLKWKELKGERFFWINSGAILFSGGCVFGWVPASFLAAIPLLNRVGHVCTDFSFLLIIHLTIQSAYGFACLIKVNQLRQVISDFVWIGAIFAGMFVLYSFGYAHHPLPWNYFLCAGAGAIGAPLLYLFLKNRRQTFIGWAGIIVLGFIPNFRFGLYNFGDDKLLMLFGPRVTLNAPSPAINKIKKENTEPYRVVGLQLNFMGDYSAVYKIEDVRSCAPLSNMEFMNLLQNFPGMETGRDWVIRIANLEQAQPLLNLLNIKYLLTSPTVELGGNLNFRLADRSDFGVLENLEVWPRAFFSDKVLSIPSNEAFIHHLIENGKQPFIALTPEEIEREPILQQLEMTNQPTTLSSATNYLLSVNSTEFDIHAPSAGMVCLTEGQAKDFTATANNEPKEVLTVNRAFKGIYLDKAGDYHIKFTYRPRYWRLACALFWISAGMILLMILIKFGKGQNAKADNFVK